MPAMRIGLGKDPRKTLSKLSNEKKFKKNVSSDMGAQDQALLMAELQRLAGIKGVTTEQISAGLQTACPNVDVTVNAFQPQPQDKPDQRAEFAAKLQALLAQLPNITAAEIISQLSSAFPGMSINITSIENAVERAQTIVQLQSNTGKLSDAQEANKQDEEARDREAQQEANVKLDDSFATLSEKFVNADDKTKLSTSQRALTTAVKSITAEQCAPKIVTDFTNALADVLVAKVVAGIPAVAPKIEVVTGFVDAHTALVEVGKERGNLKTILPAVTTCCQAGHVLSGQHHENHQLGMTKLVNGYVEKKHEMATLSLDIIAKQAMRLAKTVDRALEDAILTPDKISKCREELISGIKPEVEYLTEAERAKYIDLNKAEIDKYRKVRPDNKEHADIVAIHHEKHDKNFCKNALTEPLKHINTQHQEMGQYIGKSRKEHRSEVERINLAQDAHKVANGGRTNPDLEAELRTCNENFAKKHHDAKANLAELSTKRAELRTDQHLQNVDKLAPEYAANMRSEIELARKSGVPAEDIEKYMKNTVAGIGAAKKEGRLVEYMQEHTAAKMLAHGVALATERDTKIAKAKDATHTKGQINQWAEQIGITPERVAENKTALDEIMSKDGPQRNLVIAATKAIEMAQNVASPIAIAMVMMKDPKSLSLMLEFAKNLKASNGNFQEALVAFGESHPELEQLVGVVKSYTKDGKGAEFAQQFAHVIADAHDKFVGMAEQNPAIQAFLVKEQQVAAARVDDKSQEKASAPVLESQVKVPTNGLDDDIRATQTLEAGIGTTTTENAHSEDVTLSTTSSKGPATIKDAGTEKLPSGDSTLSTATAKTPSSSKVAPPTASLTELDGHEKEKPAVAAVVEKKPAKSVDDIGVGVKTQRHLLDDPAKLAAKERAKDDMDLSSSSKEKGVSLDGTFKDREVSTNSKGVEQVKAPELDRAAEKAQFAESSKNIGINMDRLAREKAEKLETAPPFNVGANVGDTAPQLLTTAHVPKGVSMSPNTPPNPFSALQERSDVELGMDKLNPGHLIPSTKVAVTEALGQATGAGMGM